MNNSAPITLAQLFRYRVTGLSHQDAAIGLLEEDLRTNGYATAMRRNREWFKVWSQSGKQPDKPPATPTTTSCLHLSRTGRIDGRGLELLRLLYMVGNSAQGELLCVSGVAYRQNFRTGRDSKPGSLEPLPEGEYAVADIAWAGGVDNYNASWSTALGPVSVPLTYVAPGSTERANIEIHIDANSATSPGTAGCVGIQNRADFKTLVSWLRRTDPRRLYVDWGLGTCPRLIL